MPVIFGHELKGKTLWIGGGLIAAAVAVVVFLRARSGSAQAAATTQPQSDQGAGMSVAAPTGQVADQYQQQLQNSELEANAIANKYQSNLVGQQQKQFDFQQKQMEALAPDYLASERAALGVQTHYNKAAAKAAISCPGNASVRTDPGTGQLYCRQKTSGSWGPLPVGGISRTVQGVVSGAEAAAPSIGYQAAQQAWSYYSGESFPQKTVAPSSGNPAARPVQSPANPTPPKQFTPGIAPHGYGELV